MNTYQRRFLVGGLAVAALVTHFWFCAWGWRSRKPEEAVLALFTTDVRRSHRYPDGMTYDEAKAKLDAEIAASRADKSKVGQPALLDERLRGVESEPMPIDESGNLLTTIGRDETLGLWPRARIGGDGAMVVGVFVPLALAGAAVFIALGGRRARPSSA